MGCNKPISSFFQCNLIGISTFQLNKNYPQSTKVEIAKVVLGSMFDLSFNCLGLWEWKVLKHYFISLN